MKKYYGQEIKFGENERVEQARQDAAGKSFRAEHRVTTGKSGDETRVIDIFVEGKYQGGEVIGGSFITRGPEVFEP